MRFYAERVLPWAMEKVMGVADVQDQRAPALVEVRGWVLEIGVGFGGSLGHYPQERGQVLGVVGLDPNPGMLRRARRRLASAAFPVALLRATAEAVPLKDRSFDTVVSQWTLCSIPGLAAALLEIRRVLRPGGRFLFVEHGRADDLRLARWQKRWNPIHGVLAGGCQLDVPVDDAIREAGFEIDSLERYEARPGPRILTQMYRGSARPVRSDVGEP